MYMRMSLEMKSLQVSNEGTKDQMEQYEKKFLRPSARLVGEQCMCSIRYIILGKLSELSKQSYVAMVPMVITRE